jgi:hypothetical protein
MDHRLVGSTAPATTLEAGLRKTFVCWRSQQAQDGQAPQSEKMDDFSTLYIRVRKGVDLLSIPRVDELVGLSMRLGVAVHASMLPHTSTTPALLVREHWTAMLPPSRR